MASKPELQKFLKKHVILPDSIYSPIGKISTTWNSIQLILFHMFWGFLGLTQEEAESVFYSIASDKAQTDIVKNLGIVKLSLKDTRFIQEFSDLMDEIQKNRGKRNDVMHHTIVVNLFGDMFIGKPRSRHNERLRTDYLKSIKKIDEESIDLFLRVVQMYDDLGKELAW